MKKILCTLLVVVMMLGIFAACNTATVTPTGTTGNEATEGSKPTTITIPNTDQWADVEPIEFPLKEKVTFTMMAPRAPEEGAYEKWIAHPLYKKLFEETNVEIKVEYLDDFNATFARLLQTGDYFDFYCGGSGNVIPTNNAVEYFDSGILVPITEYINPKIMPNFWEDLMELPEMFGMITAPDGEIYTLPKITSWGPQCHENPYWINKTWLDKLDLDVPETLEEFTAVLKAFATEDPNGNGEADEIAWLVSSTHNNMNLEALYAFWGYGVKQGVNDMFLQVIDGEVIMSVTEPAYQEYLTWLKEMYDEGIMWNEVFTGTTINDIFNSTELCKFGFCTNSTPPTKTTDEWVTMKAVSNGDVTPRIFYNCAVWGSKGQFYVTNKCENVDILCAWMDKFFDLENAYMSDNHPDTYTVKDGVYTKIADLDPVVKENAYGFPSYVGGNWPRSFMASDYKYMPVTDATSLLREEAYNVNAEFINKEIWPRPYWSVDAAGEIGTLAAPIDKAIKAWRAEFILGTKDIEADWAAFESELAALDLDTFMELAQEAYDVVAANIDAMKAMKK